MKNDFESLSKKWLFCEIKRLERLLGNSNKKIAELELESKQTELRYNKAVGYIIEDYENQINELKKKVGAK